MAACSQAEAQRISYIGPRMEGVRLLGLVSSDGSRREELLTKVPDLGGMLQWAPDGRHAAVLRREDDATYLADIEQGILIQCLDCGLEGASQPEFSPDGTMIALSERSGLYVTRLDGRGLIQLSSLPDPAWLTWSPDGKSIGFGYWDGGTIHIFRVDLADSRVTNLTQTYGEGGDFEAPQWSPRGDLIAFNLHRRGFHVAVMNPDGTGMREIADRKMPFEGYEPGSGPPPVWSPDGEKIAFVSTSPFGDLDIFSVNVDGTGLKNVSNHPGGDYRPAWSPDGDRMAFISTRDGNAEVYVINVDGTDARRLTDTPFIDEESPAWRPRPDEGPSMWPIAAGGAALLVILALGAGARRRKGAK